MRSNQEMCELDELQESIGEPGLLPVGRIQGEENGEDADSTTVHLVFFGGGKEG